jgi:integrase
MRKALTPISIANLRPRVQKYEVSDGGCQGLRIEVQPTGHKSGILRYRFGGRTRKLTLGSFMAEAPQSQAAPVLDTPLTLADMRFLAAEALRQMRSGIDPGEVKQKIRRGTLDLDDTVRAVAARYLQQHAEQRSIRLKKYDFEFIVDALGSRPIAAVKRSDIVRICDHIEATSGPAAADRVASSWGTLAKWHAGRVDDYRPPIIRGRSNKRNKNGARERVLTDGEIRRVWAASLTHQSPFGPLVRFLLTTGVRRNEAAKMRRSELTDPTMWTIPANRSKIKKDILVPLSGAAQAILTSIPQIANSDLVFTGDGRRAFSSFDRKKQELDAVSKVSDWRIHDLRRTARTLLSRAGVDADIAERCVGHVVGGMRGVYDKHRYEAEMRVAFEKLAALLEHIINPPADNVVDGALTL